MIEFVTKFIHYLTILSASNCILPMRAMTSSKVIFLKTFAKLDGCIVLNEHNTVLGSKRLAICATVYMGVQK